MMAYLWSAIVSLLTARGQISVSPEASAASIKPLRCAPAMEAEYQSKFGRLKTL
jgi:hypothetical protein